jgi:hypothetical protein
MGGMSYVRDTDTPRIKLHLDFNLSRLMAVDFVIGTATSNERQAYRTMLRASVTYVLDRGYMAFALLRDSIAAKAHVIMRACNNIVVETIEELTIACPFNCSSTGPIFTIDGCVHCMKTPKASSFGWLS